MKITAQQYAKSLYETTKGKSQGEVDSVLVNFVGIIAKNNQLKFRDKIISKFSEIYNKENSVVEAEVISREEIGGELRNKLLTYVSNKYGAKEVVLNNIIDKNIKGGVIVRVGDEVMDGSIRRQLEELKNSLNH